MAIKLPDLDNFTDILSTKCQEAIDKLVTLPIDSESFTICLRNLDASLQMLLATIKKEDKNGPNN